MKNTIIGLLFFFHSPFTVFSQYVLDTPDGKQVKLNTNGTWVYVKNNSSKGTNTTVPPKSTAKYTSNYRKYEMWYDPSLWVLDTGKKDIGFTWDAFFYSKDFAIVGYCLDSRLTMPFEYIEAGIKEQWKDLGEIKYLNSHKDTLNNIPVTFFEMEYTRDAVLYLYKGFVYSDAKGSFQFTIGTQKEIFEEDKDKIDLLIKGFLKSKSSITKK